MEEGDVGRVSSSLPGKLVRWEPEEAPGRCGGHTEIAGPREGSWSADRDRDEREDLAACMSLMQLPLMTAVFSIFCPFGFLSQSTPTLVLIGFLRFATGVLRNTPVKRQHRLQMDSLPPASTLLPLNPNIGTSFAVVLGSCHLHWHYDIHCAGAGLWFSLWLSWVMSPDPSRLGLVVKKKKTEHAGGLRLRCWAEVRLLRPCTFRSGWSSAVVSDPVFLLFA